MSKKIVFSGVQPSGDIHIGNYFGAVKQFVDFQDSHECIYSIVDLHAITVWQDPNLLRNNIHEVLSIFLAAGLDPDKNIIFNQSKVSEHSELAWLLGCTARVGWLNRMTQFKDKVGKNKDTASVGLYTYPILMAADILLYKANQVPVGDDQKQHLELARDIAQKFNNDYKVDFFKLPVPIMNKNATRIMSLRDARNKMSKSDVSEFSRIMIKDSNDEIIKKVMKAKTDSMKMPENIDSSMSRPEINNLINIYSVCNNLSKEATIEKFALKNIADFKKDLADVIINTIEPISKNSKKLFKDKSYLDDILKVGAERAKNIASYTIKETKKIIGMM
ncbi:MAG: tryptophan--tRNA ligase [Gammaproteobacteria bacterium]|nr:tryptophan--tRNA ligase [Gammaproteobacteria bacterium]|tara:strand:+ start:80752 stop:81750 length:999 start_codon:yes stop_codon:yes gene_type:complete